MWAVEDRTIGEGEAGCIIRETSNGTVMAIVPRNGRTQQAARDIAVSIVENHHALEILRLLVDADDQGDGEGLSNAIESARELLGEQT